MTLFLQDTDATLYHGDALTVLRELPDGCVQTCVTSPPYFGLRDYGAPGQLGLEATPDEYVTRLVGVFREVRRVLRPDGTLWLNLGDSYATTAPGTVVDPGAMTGKHVNLGAYRRGSTPPGLKPKDLVGIPWRTAFALQADGWYLRSDIIWSKPNPMPESVTDRPTKAHEYVFLLSKRPRYFWDADAIREPYTPDGRKVTTVQSGNGAIGLRGVGERERWAHAGRNVRSVWEIATQPYPDAHFAVFPQELARRCILAGTSERGCCSECGAPWERETMREIDDSRPPTRRVINEPQVTQAGQGTNARGSETWGHWMRSRTLGWRPSCGHDAATVPATVLDPFAGSGTVGLVARNHGRHAVLIELSEAYCQLAADRLAQQSLLAEASL